MRRYSVPKAFVSYWDGDDPPEGDTVLTEYEIMYGRGYWHFYRMKMKEVGKEADIDYEDALDSWVVGYYGVEAED